MAFDTNVHGRHLTRMSLALMRASYDGHGFYFGKHEKNVGRVKRPIILRNGIPNSVYLGNTSCFPKRFVLFFYVNGRSEKRDGAFHLSALKYKKPMTCISTRMSQC